MTLEASASFVQGTNCWRMSRADRFGWLIDAQAYFHALRDSIGKAEHEILILGWDIDSRIPLIRDPKHPCYPSPLAETLETLVREKPGLNVHVLSWDFSVIYLLERELLPARSFGWQDSERLHFRLDGKHPVGASHHQKLVVIDGVLAFSGGIDLTKARWDTREHAADDPGRQDPDGNAYRPFHDVQAVVSGPVAADLRELISERWANATGKPLPGLAAESTRADEIWPEIATVRGTAVETAIARTWVQPDAARNVREVKQLYIEMIRSAQDYLYIENQYFTAPEIATALAERLRSEAPPEVVLVLPAETSGWLEQATMDVLRNQALARLKRADHRSSLRVVSPVLDELGDVSINVHAKVMVADGALARIGSANLSQRSMGLDTECDLVVKDDQSAGMLAADLLAEHMGATLEDVADSLERVGLHATIDRFNGGPRRLEALETEAGDLEQIVLQPVAEVADLEKPLMRGSGGAAEGGGSHQTTMRTPVSGWVFAGLAAAVLALWIFLGLQAGDDIDPRALLDTLRGVSAHPAAPWLAVPAFVAASLVVAPVTAMIALCGLLFDPYTGVAVAIAGTLAATVVNHWIGVRFADVVSDRIPAGVSARIQRIAQASDMWSLAGLRLIPIAPFTIVNLVAGASGVRLRQFLAGTLIGMGPGIVLICLSVDRARAAISGDPVFEPWIVAAIAAAGASLILLRARRVRSGGRDD